MAKNLAILVVGFVGLAAGILAVTGYDGAVSAEAVAPSAAPVPLAESGGATISGLVTDPLPAPAPVADATVGVLVGWLGTSPILFPSAVTDPTGAYQLLGVPEGLQTLVTMVPPASGFKPNPSLASVVNVPSANETLTVDIPLPGAPEAQAIKGVSGVSVTLAGDKPRGVNVPRTLTAVPSGGVAPFTFSWREAAQNPAAGLLPKGADVMDTIQVRLPLPGTYTFLVGVRDGDGTICEASAAVTLIAEGVATEAVAQALAAAPADGAGVEIAPGVVAGATVLSGKVVDVAGAPVEGASVILVPSVVNAALSAELGMPEPVVPVVTPEPIVTDFMGTFGVMGVPDGIYVAQVALPDGTSFAEPVVVKGATEVILYQGLNTQFGDATFTVVPDAPLVSVGPVGGPFVPELKQYTLSNLTASVLVYNITQTANPPTMGFRPPGAIGRTSLTGTLTALGSQVIEVYLLTGYAGTLSEGAYLDTVTFKDNGSGNTITRQADLAVGTLVADFTANKTEVVAGQAIQFTNRSSGPYTSLDWDFGDGSTHVSSANPSYAYTDYLNDPYTVTLTATGPAGSTSSALAGIVVYQQAVAQFIYTGAPPTFVAPVDVQFNTAGCQGDYETLTWDFGDGTAPLTQNRADPNPMHHYTASSPAPAVAPDSPNMDSKVAGYPVSLTLRGRAGNVSNVTHAIAVFDSFTACFDATLPDPAITPATVTFDSTCSTGVFTTKVWNFGDGSPVVTRNAGDPDPEHEYTVSGTYTVTMTMNGPGGAQDAVSHDYTFLESFKAQFSATTATAIVAGQSVCFRNESFGPYTSLEWNFGDGSAPFVWHPGDPGQNPCHVYTDYTHDPYTVTLTAFGAGGLQDTATLPQGITVYQPPTAGFTVTQDSPFAPAMVTFNRAASTGDYTTLVWHFDDGSAPLVLAASAPDPSHTYAQAGSYNPSLILQGPAGASAPYSLPVQVYNAYTAAFTQDKLSGPTPLTVAFSDISTGDYETVSWNFGDGTGAHPGEVQKSYPYTYGTKGIYTVALTIAGHGGAPDILTKEALITVYAASKACFTYVSNPPSQEMPAEIQFSSQCSAGDYTSLTWNFGDGTAPVTLSRGTPDPSHTYAESGDYQITLTLGGDGGQDVTEQTITVFPPLKPCFTYTAAPANRFVPVDVTFDSTCSEGNFSTLTWDFGDTGTLTQNRGAAAPMHAYTLPGSYTVKLTLSGAAGEKSTQQTIQTYAPITACFTYLPEKPVVNADITFDSACSTGDYETLDWTFDDGATLHQDRNKATTPIKHAFATMGNHDVKLVASGHGVSIEVTKTIAVYASINTQFTTQGPRTGIRPFTVAFVNQTTGDANTFTWTFGDGITSSETNPTHTYDVASTYTVTLTASGNGGTNVNTKPGYITVYAPVEPQFLASPPNGLVPLSVTFTDQSTGDYDKVAWDFGDGSDTEETPPRGSTKPHVYSKSGTYVVTLLIYDKMGGSHTKTTEVGVYTPVDAKFSATPLQGPFPLDVTFTDQSTGDYETATWDFGDGTLKQVTRPSVTRSISHVYDKRGFYTVTLVVEGNGGKASKTLLVSAFTPVNASFSADKTSGPASLTVAFTSTSTGDFDKYLWIFGDGTTGAAGPAISHTYTAPGDYNVSLTVSGGGGSDVSPDPPKVFTIRVFEPVKADFDVSPTEGLAPLVVHFLDRSSGNPTSFSWDFDSDGTVDSTDRNPTHTYAVGGVYTVSLKATGPGGTDTMVKRNVVSAFKPVLHVQPTTVSLLAVTGRDYPISVRNDGNGVLRWKATVVSGGEWMSITPTAEFLGDGEILIDYQQNLLSTERTGQISVEAADADGSPVTITVTQDGAATAPTPELDVAPGSRSVDSAAGTTTFDVNNGGGGDLEWTAQVREGSSWLSIVSGASGVNKGTVTVAFTQNVLEMPREGTVRIRGLNPGLGFVDVTVTQASAPANPELAVTPDGQSIGAAGGITLFAVTNPDGGTLYWTASAAPGSEWLTITSGDSGTNTGIITILCAKNDSHKDRIGHIRVVSTSAPEDVVDVTVTQEGCSFFSCYGSPSTRSGGGGADMFLLGLAAAMLFVTGKRKASRSN